MLAHLLGVVLLAASSTPAPDPAATAGAPPTRRGERRAAHAVPLDTAALEQAIADEMRATRTPGVAIAVVAGDRVVYAKGFGVRSVETGEPVTPATLFRIGSTTKMVTGLAAILLAREGRLDLRAPVGRVARGLAPPLARLTTDQLLSHRAGLVNEASGTGPHDDEALGRRVRGWGAEYVLGPPNDVYSYSGPGYWLAGYVLEQAAGVPFADAVAARVLRPLGMTRSTFRPLEAMTYPLAQDHRVTERGAAVLRPFTDDVTTWASGSLFSSAEEMARFAIAVLNEGRVDGRQAIPADAVAALREARSSTPDSACGYGYGLAACRRAEGRTLSHYGFRAGSGSVVTMQLDRRAAVVVLANRNGGIFARSAAKALELLGPRAAPGAAPGPARAADSSGGPRARGATPALTRLAGVYANGRDTLRLVAASGALRYRYGADEFATRADGPAAFLVLDGAGQPVQRFEVVRGSVSGAPYLHDGLQAFRRIDR